MSHELSLTTLDLSDVYISALRWLIGLLIGSTAGTLLGVMSYYLGRWREFLDRPLDFMRAIPIIGLVPLIQLTIGYGEAGKFLLIGWGTAFPIWLSVLHALQRESPELELVLKCYRLSAMQRFRAYIFPRLLGGVVEGVKISISIGWLCVVAAEFIGIFQSGFWAAGLGYLVMNAHQLNDWGMAVAGLAIFGAMGLATSKGWDILFQRFLFTERAGFNPVHWVKRGG